MTTPPAIEVAGLTKSFGDHAVLRGLDLSVASGRVLALLGSNGAGKTTAVRILSTLLKADGGTARVNGYDVAAQPAQVRESISLTGQFAAVDEVLTGRENLVLIAELRGVAGPGRVADDLLARFDLAESAGRRVATYSGGMRRRLDISMSLIGEPPVLFLDEPTTGLDPQSRLEVWKTVQQLTGQGTTVLLTTQYLDEAEHLADRIAILDRGKLVAEETAAELKRRVPAGYVRLTFADAHGLESAVRTLGGAAPDDDALTLQVPTDGRVGSLKAVLDRLDDRSLAVAGLSLHSPDLDDVFFALTGHLDREKDEPR